MFKSEIRIKILTSNYQAEYGRNGGGVITVITKSGSRDFHGSAYDFYRHESLNANSFFRNRTNTPKPPYRYRITGYTLGGPVYIPKVFNTAKDKLFFFWSQEYVGMKKDYGTRYVNMPAALERAGDFSQSYDSSGKLIQIYDPLTGKPFPGNVIPKDRINPLGSAILNFFPLPNYVDPDPRNLYTRNYRSAYSGAYPKREDLIRIDANPFPSLQVYWRYVQDKDEQQVPYGLWVNGHINYFLTPIVFGQPGNGHVVHVNKMLSPSLINEFIFGKSHNNLYFYPKDPSAVDRSKVGNPAQWFADQGTGVNYLKSVNYMPNLVFGGQPASVVNVRFGNIPYENFNDIYSFVDNISKVINGHTPKAGVYIGHTRKYQVGGLNNRGEFNFSTNADNPFDSKDSYANALLGVINSYSEGTARVNGDWYF